MTVCAAPNCAIPLNLEVDPVPFCSPHWSVLDVETKGAVHRGDLEKALEVIAAAEEYRARPSNWTRYCHRPSARA